MSQIWLGVGQQINTVGDQETAAGYDDMAQKDRGLSASPPAQIEQRVTDFCRQAVSDSLADFLSYGFRPPLTGR